MTKRDFHPVANIFPLMDEVGPLEVDELVAEQIADHGAVYLIGTRVGGLVKIGHSIDPQRRIRQLQTAQAHRLEILCFIPGTQSLEHGLHNLFKDLRVGGEWYADKNFEISHTFRSLLSLFRDGSLKL